MFGTVFEKWQEMNMTGRHMKLEQSGDSELVREVALGRKDALKVIMDRYLGLVARTSYRILCDRQDGEDITREVFMKVWAGASMYDGRDLVYVWICRITCNLCMARMRRRRLLDLLSIRPSVYEESSPASVSSYEDFITKETWAVYCRASQELSSKQRMVFVLSEIEKLSISDVRSITGMTTEQIKENLRMARSKVRQELEIYGTVR